MRIRTIVVIIILCFVMWSFCYAAQQEKKEINEKNDKKTEENTEIEDELTLEKLFPETSIFGPSARGIAFSFDDKYAAYLYRPYIERRHGNDLWIYNVESGEAKRITSVSVMSEFQKSTREVGEYRIKRYKEKMAKKSSGDEDKKNTKEEEKVDEVELTEKEMMDWVDEDDAEINKDVEDEEKKAPRYDGIGRITWSETSNELIFESDGDLYLLNAGDEKPTRLTRTNERESSITWLPDGTGYLSKGQCANSCHIRKPPDRADRYRDGQRRGIIEISLESRRQAYGYRHVTD